MLVDSGNTHNFENHGLAHKIGCKLDPIHSQPIAVADGSELRCQYICHNFKWKFQGTEFSSAVLLIPLGNCDMVLGVQWISQLGNILWNFKTLHMEFCWAGKRHVLRELQGPKVKLIQGSQLPQAMENGFQLCMMQLMPSKGITTEDWCCLTLSKEDTPD